MATQAVSISDSNSHTFEQFWGIYEEALPPGERKTKHAIEALLDRDDYRILGLAEGNILIAFAIFFLSPTQPIALLEYMASDRRCRNRGVGAALFNTSLHAIGDRTVLIEVDSDREKGDDSEIRSRRKNFYRRLGCREIKGLRYIMPAVADAPPPRMNLLVRIRSAGEIVAKAQLRAWLEEIYVAVYRQTMPDSRIDTMLQHVTDPVTISL